MAINSLKSIHIIDNPPDVIVPIENIQNPTIISNEFKGGGKIQMSRRGGFSVAPDLIVSGDEKQLLGIAISNL
jgi:hypothetical protein